MEQRKEEEERRSHGHHITRKLNFNAPLLTTRRPAGKSAGLKVSGTDRKVTSASERVPFSWEQAPGKPKESIERYDGAATPRPTLPPSWWRPPEHGTSRNLHRRRNHAGEVSDELSDEISSGCYVLSDGEDVFSLSEAIDIVEKADELRVKRVQYEEEEEEEEEERRRRCCNEASNFMMERFLPDATALAASTALNHSWSCSNRGGVSPPLSPTKGCGLDVLFPWRTKHGHQLCGVKSPVRHSCQSSGISKSSAKQKKQY